ncbi:MAG TPA: glycoside hydrolase family 43 protein [Candidatus Anaerobiospirillum stercoravium]|nr:glycoside hydrolase family 43 protein [Candidatus Anaerobiospirillum stercoravium]
MKITNPILPGYNPDPSILRVGDDYYIATSTFEWFPGVRIHHSRDLKHWELIALPLNTKKLLDMTGNGDGGGIWAPCLSYHEGKFYLIYTDMKTEDSSAFRDGHNYLTTATDIRGPWSDPIFLNSSGFDPSLFHDDDGRKYLVNPIWDHRIGHHWSYGIVMQEFSEAEGKLVGPAKVIWKGTPVGMTEGPHLYKKDGYYYLMCAEGGTDYHHSETIARSRDIWGPYEADPQTPFLSAYYDPTNPLQKCGHASLVETQNGEWYLAHLMGRPLELGRRPLFDLNLYGCCPLGRETSLQKIEWVEGWPRVVGGRQGALEIEGPNLPECPVAPTWPQSGKDDFDSTELNINYQWLRIPLTEQMVTLKERPGHLRIYGYESLASYHTQALIARRWESFNFDAETCVEFEPDTFQQLAGLTCFYNRDNFTFIFVSWDEEKGRCIDLIGRSVKNYYAPLKNQVIAIPEDVKKVYFKVEVRHDTYRYLYSFDGSTFTAIDYEFRSGDLSDDHVERNGGRAFFTGAFVGMTCIDMQGTHKPADFDYFSYKNVEA